MSSSTKRRSRRPTRVERMICWLASFDDPADVIARRLGLTLGEVEQRLRLPHVQAYLADCRRRNELSPEEWSERLVVKARAVLDEYLRDLDVSGVLPN